MTYWALVTGPSGAGASRLLLGDLKMLTLTFYSDPGHGWLEVDRDVLVDLGIADEVSSYSYQRGDKVFLEWSGDDQKAGSEILPVLG